MHTQTQQIQIFTYVPSSPIHTFYRVIIIWNTKSQSHICAHFLSNAKTQITKPIYDMQSLFHIKHSVSQLDKIHQNVSDIYQVQYVLHRHCICHIIDVDGLTFQRESFFAGSDYYIIPKYLSTTNILKFSRVNLTFRVKSAHKLKLTDKQLLQWLFPILLVMIIYLAAWTLSDPPQVYFYLSFVK